MSNDYTSGAFSPSQFSFDTGRKNTDELGPHDIVTSSTKQTSHGGFRWQYAKGRRSTELEPDELAPSNRSYQTTACDFLELSPDEISPDQLAPDKLGYQETLETDGEHSTQSRGTGLASYEQSVVKPLPVHQAYTPADRKTTNASLQATSLFSTFSKPASYRTSWKNRISIDTGPHAVAAKSSSPTTPATPNSTGSGNCESPSISPGGASGVERSQTSTSIPTAGGLVDDTNPFFTSGNPFAREPRTSRTISITSEVPAQSTRASFSNHLSRNFSKKLSTIAIPEDGVVSQDQSFVDSTPIRTPTPLRTSFASGYERKKSRATSVTFAGVSLISEKTARPSLVITTDMTLPESRKPSTAVNSRRTSAMRSLSATSSTRPSLVGLGGSRRSSVSITNVVIPAHLLTHVETNWNEDKVVGRRKSAYKREDSRGSFNVQSMAQKQQEEIKNIIDTTPQAPRHMSESMEDLAYADPFATMRDRQASSGGSKARSLAAVSESEKADFEEVEEKDEAKMEQQIAPDDKSGRLTPWGNFVFDYHERDISPGATASPIDPLEAAGAAMGVSRVRDAEKTNATPHRPSMWRLGATTNVNAHGGRRGTIIQRAGSVFQDSYQHVRKKVRRSSMWDVYENAKKRQIEIRRKRWVQILFEYTFYAMILAVSYFLIIGVPLWKGAYWELYLAFKHKLNLTGSWSIVIAVAFAYAYSPLLILFEPDPPMPEEPIDPTKTHNVADTALMIPCYKAASLIGATLEAATKVFPPSHIFVVANGNSPTPLDETEEICRPYGVNHVWSPVGSKIVAQFVGCYAAKEFKNILLIDDDCALPPNFPIVSDRLKGKVMCMGYTIKSVGPSSSKGTLCQQAQDLEYKISGIQRALAGKIGSATFPHGAISLWDREFLIKTFTKHPGFSVSEDWFFGHVARQLGCRTQMATSVFIETETPSSVFFSSGGSRGGFGEMTVFKQRFLRWNFFFVNGMYYNLHYILFSWELGWWELGTKLFVFQEIYETLLYLATPIVVPISLAVRPQFFFELMALTFVLYMTNAIIFNELHLRRKNEKVPQKCVWFYYMPYKLILTFVNVASCYYAIYKYATYFANRHPKIIEDEKAVNVVLQLEEEDVDDDPVLPAGGRRMSVTAVGSQVDVPGGAPGGRRMTITAMGQSFNNPDSTITEEEEEEEVSKKPERKAPVNFVKAGDAHTSLEPRRPSIMVQGRRISISSNSFVKEAPATKTRRTSDAFRSKGISAATIVGHRTPDSVRSRGIDDGPLRPVRPKFYSARGSIMDVIPVLEEAEEEENDFDEKKLDVISTVGSERHSKRGSQLMQSDIAPVVEVTETEMLPTPPEPSIDDRLLNCVNAIEEALAARGIDAVEFTVHDDNVAEVVSAAVEANEDFISVSETIAEEEKKHPDAKSMV
ncbi:hypothetical protein E4T38_02375 [Aureobasidium subglaciale]|nr:hypothetical protein E4T38_02375 [Aureobasidium subglaciale]KAI5228573.1 hypothetical protein E4T40_02154 [Aureobasidium subglaciale]KAI5231999.1 hypothetical protein E4T41_02374 [Aureobasidium subglaciale]KAI5265718.1 hypothetical protein E4T46_02152 [Aureobasidium subglaciale]